MRLLTSPEADPGREHTGLGQGVCTTLRPASLPARLRAGYRGRVLRQLLSRELAARRGRNARYSLRAFARDLGLHHGTLAQLLHGRRRFTTRSATALVAALGATPDLARATSEAAEEQALLTAVARHDFTPCSRHLAVRSGLRVDAVNAALFRVLASGRLRMTDTHQWEIHE